MKNDKHALLFAIIFIAATFFGCTFEDDGTKTFYVDLKGGKGWHYYLGNASESKYFDEGCIDKQCNIHPKSDIEMCVAKFKISGPSLKITLFEGQTLSTLKWENYFYVYNGDGYDEAPNPCPVGYVEVAEVNGRQKLRYQVTSTSYSIMF